MITRKEIYGTLSVLIRNTSVLVRCCCRKAGTDEQTSGKANDPITGALEELEGPPVDYDKSNTPVRLRLTNRLAELKRKSVSIPSVVH